MVVNGFRCTLQKKDMAGKSLNGAFIRKNTKKWSVFHCHDCHGLEGKFKSHQPVGTKAEKVKGGRCGERVADDADCDDMARMFPGELATATMLAKKQVNGGRGGSCKEPTGRGPKKRLTVARKHVQINLFCKQTSPNPKSRKKV